MVDPDFDAIVVGTGFAGAVTACRLVEAGYTVLVLERGRRFEKNDFPTYPAESLLGSEADSGDSAAAVPDFSRWLWRRDYGIYDIRDLDHVVSVQAAGYGGGSLIYANVHLRPPLSTFDERWPEEYRHGRLDGYFDLAAYLLRVAPIPTRLAKTLQLRRAAQALNGGSDEHWFRAPLAINFEGDSAVDGENAYGREQHPCDMRGRCCAGCDRQAKNTLDLNYLARAEQGGADIRTLAEVTQIEREGEDVFKVTYKDLLLHGERRGQGEGKPDVLSVRGRKVFLCAGAVNTTELLLRYPALLGARQKASPDRTPLGSGYFPNADSLAAVFDCDEPQEADYGPTITSAVLHQSAATGSFSCSLDFRDGHVAPGNELHVERRRQGSPYHGRDGRVVPGEELRAGMEVRGESSQATAVLAHAPILDWGAWAGDDAAGTLVLADVKGHFQFEDGNGEILHIGGGKATARVRSALRRHEHWFLVQDGGYPPDLEPLVGIFRSPLWLRRNRFIEGAAAVSRPDLVPRRPAPQRLRLDVLTDALRGTVPQAASSGGLLDRGLSPQGVPARTRAAVAEPGLPPDLLETPLETFFPRWLRKAVEEERNALIDDATAFALPMLGLLLDGLAGRLARQLDPETVAKFGRSIGGGIRRDDPRKEVLIRGMLRQALQVLGGGEAELATSAAKLLLEPLPGTPEALLERLGSLVLRAIAYGDTDGHTAIVLTMGRDLYRGRLFLEKNDKSPDLDLKARLPGRLLDTSAALQERALRVIAGEGWRGELRTNPAWATLERRLTVHSQGGCPMGPGDADSVTRWTGEVHGCRGLYVMDAAAFPTSVGVNPSATILAVTERKIEEFIRSDARKNLPDWKARDWDEAAAWAATRRHELDPLNSPAPRPPTPEPALPVLGLRFKERMEGFFADAKEKLPPPTHDLERFLDGLDAFRNAEDEGIRKGWTIDARLNARTGDLAQLVAADAAVVPVRIALGGIVNFDDTTFRVHERDSFLQMFVAPSKDLPVRIRFFRYSLRLDARDGSNAWTLEGVKVLRNDPGSDLWLDTSTLYFELSNRLRVRHGILRLSLEKFLRMQMPSMRIIGTSDPMRRIWALTAFYKFFAREISRIYASRADAATRLFVNAITSIHV